MSYEKLTALIRCAVLLLIATQGDAADRDDSTWRFSSVERVVAVSDLHGAYESAVATLQAAGLIDENLAWSGERTHLVVAGDIFDRGPRSRLIADLLIRLETEAETAGGRVHVLLGNHEVMNMVGDLRYVADAEFAAFAEEESNEEREHWRRLVVSDQRDTADLGVPFEGLAPPGFFAHRRAFAPNGRYGKWLLAKPFLIVINDTAYVHGGLSPLVTENGLANTNRLLKRDLTEFVTARAKLESGAVVTPLDAFRGLPALLSARLNASDLDAEDTAAATSARELRESALHRPEGPVWYRGNARCNTLSEGDVLNGALNAVGAQRVVIGHTTTATRKIQSRHGGRVLEVNTGMLASHYGGRGQALIIESGRVSVVDQEGKRSSALARAPRRVGGRPADLDDAAVSDLLTTGRIIGSLSRDSERQLVQVAKAGKSVPAYFEPAQEDGSMPALAAYEIDKLIGLNMVPVTVRRTTAGRTGALQLAIVDATTESDRLESGIRDQGACPIDRQHTAMRVFDALINNPARPTTAMLYDEDWNLILTEHRDAFSDLDNQLVRPTLADGLVDGEWHDALTRLRDQQPTPQLGGALSAVRLSAFTERLEELVDGSSE